MNAVSKDSPAGPAERPVVLLTSMSGAGLSTALKAFEDVGYEAVDNLRLGLIPALVEDNRAACFRARSSSPKARRRPTGVR